ncbi:MAG: hypothetical protein CO189_07150 [candidate division Zixibacteria bacterium CG_4_9_14_3_um_filter_46_8]|nr:MAG: hypothetical protein CO189_07150 [candidate division Zixibacteria bacterium CG_4_9_14_3_um_filter_46_8]
MPQMKRVLFIAFYFPPISGGGVQRPLKFVKYLPEFGWLPDVLTISPGSIKSYVKDKMLLAEIPPEVTVHRAYFPDFTRLPLFRGSAAKIFFEPFKNRFLIPSNEVTWNPFAFRKAMKIIERQRPQVILSSSPPNSVHLLGLRLSQKYFLPWVMDMRDEWIHPYNMKGFCNLPEGRQLKEVELENRGLSASNKIIAVSPLMKEHIIERTGATPDKIEIISNGFDDSDYEDYEDVPPPKGEKFKIMIMGTLGWITSVQVFVECLEQLIEAQQIDPERIEISILSQSRQNKLDEYFPKHFKARTAGNFRFFGFQPHHRAIKMMSEHHAFILILNPEGKSVISGRIFEYVRGRRPIIAFIPEDGEAADVIRATNTGEYCAPNSPEKMKAMLLKYYSRWENDEFNYRPNFDEIDKYNRKALTAKLAKVLDEVVENAQSTRNR